MSKQDKFKAIRRNRDDIPANEMAAATYGGNKDLDALFGDARTTDVDASRLLTVGEDGVYRYGRIGLSPVGLDLPDAVDIEEYSDLGRLLLDVGSRIQWLIGDWIVCGDQWEYGETYRALASEFGYEEKSLREYAYVCRNVDLSIRMDNLTFGHHQVVAGMESQQQTYWLKRASSDNEENDRRWSIRRLREEIKAEQGGEQEQKSTFERLATSLSQFVSRMSDMDHDERAKAAVMLRAAAEEIESLR